MAGRGRRLRAVAAGLAALLAPVTATGCSGTPDGAEEVALAGGSALVWAPPGDAAAERGVVLAHGASYDAASWADQAEALAGSGARVVAVEELDTAALEAAVALLRDGGAEEVALVGASAGADAVLTAVTREPGLADQLVLLSPNRVVDGLGPEPTLFVASEDEPVADVSVDLSASAPGQDNDLVLLPGSAHAQGIFETDRGDAVLDDIVERVGGAAG